MNQLADAIVRDILRDEKSAPTASSCITCGRGTARSRFCSDRCRSHFDDGWPVHDPERASYSLPISGDGFRITCKGCNKSFSSRGLRCCSADCDRHYRERQEIEATIAGMAMESTGYVKRKCQHCGGDIPRYQGIGKKRRETRKDVRFCSSRCQQRAKASSVSTTPVSTAIEAQKPAWNGHSGRPPQ